MTKIRVGQIKSNVGEEYFAPISDNVGGIDWRQVITDTGPVVRNTLPLGTNTTISGTYYRVLVSGETQISLPSASGILGREYNIIRVGSQDVTIVPSGTETISGDDELVLTSQWDSVVIVSDDAGWVRCS